MPDRIQPADVLGIEPTAEANTPTPRPVPTQEDRMRDATTPARPAMTFREARDAGLLPPAVALALPQDSDPRTNTTDRTFATYLDRTERDQLDARAATAEQERDDALDDRDAYKEARDVLRAQLDRLQPLIDAALTWRRWHGNTNAAYADACQALEAAADALCEPPSPALGSPPPRAQEPIDGAASLLRQAAAGRREYAKGIPEKAEPLDLQAHTLDAAAQVVEGDLAPLYDWLPSWRWTPEMHARLHPEREG